MEVKIALSKPRKMSPLPTKKKLLVRKNLSIRLENDDINGYVKQFSIHDVVCMAKFVMQSSIINGGSFENVLSADMTEKLKLKVEATIS